MSSSSLAADPLVPLTELLPDRSRRWIAEACRAGRIPHAVRIGKSWRIRRSQYEAWTSKAPPTRTTEAEALAELRRRGVV